MAKLLILLVALNFVNFEYVSCLTCHDGAIAPAFNIKTVKERQCSDGADWCFYGSLSYVALEVIDGDAKAYLCANKSLCDTPCNEIADILIKQSTSTIDLPLDISKIPYTIKSCNKTCCQGNNCNSLSGELGGILPTKLPLQDETTQGASSLKFNSFIFAFLTFIAFVWVCKF